MQQGLIIELMTCAHMKNIIFVSFCACSSALVVEVSFLFSHCTFVLHFYCYKSDRQTGFKKIHFSMVRWPGCVAELN